MTIPRDAVVGRPLLKVGQAIWRTSVFAFIGIIFLELGAGAGAGEVSMQNVPVGIRHIDYEFAVKRDASGIPRMNWDVFRGRPRKTIDATYDGILLQNDSVRVTLIPDRGRIHSLVNRATGNELLWINPSALPLGANNDTGFWMTWGGIEHVLPRREHGTTHALLWRHQILSNTKQQATVLCQVTEPLTGLRLRLYYSLYANKNYVETMVVVENPTKEVKQFSLWTTAVFAPGGLNEVTPDTELVIPADRFVPDERDFNDWMAPLIGPTVSSPLRKIGNWQSIGDLMTSRLHQPYYAVYSHEKSEGIVHTFDLAETPTVDVWGWGYPPTPARQLEFTAQPPNKGYVEVWNGNVHGFKDDDLASLEPGEFRSWRERTFPVQNLNSKELTQAIRERVAKVNRVVSLPDTPPFKSQSPQPRIERSVIAHGSGKYDWFQARGVWVPEPFQTSLMLMQQKTHDNGHGYFDIYWSRSDDQVHWANPKPIPSLKRTTQDDGYDIVAGDLWPVFHAKTGKVLVTGKTFNFREQEHEDILREQVAYAVFDPATESWSTLQQLDLPKTDHSGREIIAPNAGCNQSVVVDASGRLLIPIRYQTHSDWRNYVSVVAECSFDGERLSYVRHGSEHSHPVGRGLYEPSLVAFQGHYFLTLRADRDGFVTNSTDGIHFTEAVRWKFDDGQPLGSYNTQQHWIVGGDRLYLVYTRRNPHGGHIIRHRAPLYVAEVDPQSLRVIRDTEQVVFPIEGRALGNSGVCRIGANESWVIVGEGAPGRGIPWTNNRVMVAKLRWSP